MKQSIEWHEMNLKNREWFLEREMAGLKRQQKKVAELSVENDNLSMQINIAKQRGKDGFDSDRFLKLRGGIR